MGNGIPCGFPCGNEDGLTVMLMKDFKSNFNPIVKDEIFEFRDDYCTFNIKNEIHLLLQVEIRDYSKCKETYVKLEIPRIGPKSDREWVTIDHTFSCKCKKKSTSCDCRKVIFKPSEDEIQMNYDSEIEKYICWGCPDVMPELNKDTTISEKFVNCYNNKRNTTLTRSHIYQRFNRIRKTLFVNLKETKIHVEHDNYNDIMITFRFVIYEMKELDQRWRNTQMV